MMPKVFAQLSRRSRQPRLVGWRATLASAVAYAALALPLAVLATPMEHAAAAEAGKRPETNAQRLHRKGVFCMEELERRDCAIEKFEELLDERTQERELITDGMLRLVKLYEKEGRVEDVKEMLRRFWDAGHGRARLGHLIYSTRYLPPDVDALAGVDIERVLAAPISQRVPPDMPEYAFTCDEQRRDQIEDIWMLRKAQRIASDKKISTNEAFAQIAKERREREQRREQREAEAKAKGEKNPGPPKPEYTPLFVEHTCVVAKAIGHDTLARWKRLDVALNHKDPRRSMLFAEVPMLDTLLQNAERRGDIEAVRDRVWKVVDSDYHGQELHIARLDKDELTAAPAGLLREIEAGSEKRKSTMNRELRSLLLKIPVDSNMFAAATEETIQDLGFNRSGRRGLLQMLLPRPKGVQVAGVVHEYLGFFIRMPTDTPLKGEMLVAIARRMISNAEEDDGDADFLKMLDVSTASDKRALLLSYVLSKSQVLEMMVQ